MQVTRTFSRVRVVALSGRVDLAVPNDMPVAELIRQTTALTSSPAVRLELRHPVQGALRRDLTLQDAGVLDGEELHLVQPLDAATAAEIDDVAEAVAHDVDDKAEWKPAANSLLLAVTTAVLAAGVSALAAVTLPHDVAVTTAAVCLGLMLLITAGTLRLPSAAGTGAAVAGTAVAAGSLLAAVGRALSWDPGVLVAAGTAAAALVAAIAALLLPAVRGWCRPAALAGASAAGLVGIFTALDAEVPQPRAAAVVACAALAATAFVPRAVAELSGLGALADLPRTGRAARRSRVELATRRARWDLAALLLGPAAVAGGMLALVSRGRGPADALAAVTALLLALRSRHFRHPVHRLALLLPALGGLAAAGVIAVVGASNAWDVPRAVAVLVVALGVATVLTPGQVGRSRLRMTYERVETLLLVAAVPLVLGVFDAYHAAYRAVR